MEKKIPVQNNCFLYLSFCRLQPKFLDTQLSWCPSPCPLSQFCELMLSLKWQQQLNPTPLRKSKRQSGKEKIWRLLYFTLLVRLIPKHVFTQRRKQIIWLKLGGLSYSQYNPNEREANWHRWCLKTKLTPAKSLDSFSFWQCTNSTHYISIEMTISGNHTNFILVEKLL